MSESSPLCRSLESGLTSGRRGPCVAADLTKVDEATIRRWSSTDVCATSLVINAGSVGSPGCPMLVPGAVAMAAPGQLHALDHLAGLSDATGSWLRTTVGRQLDAPPRPQGCARPVPSGRWSRLPLGTKVSCVRTAAVPVLGMVRSRRCPSCEPVADATGGCRWPPRKSVPEALDILGGFG
jgi:hypothetical protein